MIMSKKLLRGVCVSLFVSGVALGSAGSASAETIFDSVFKAIQTHPSVKRAHIGRDIAIEDTTQARSAYFPTVSTTMTGGRMYADNSTSRGINVTRGAGYSWLWEGNVTLNQKIFDWNETGSRVNAAKASEGATLHGIDDAQQSIAFQAIQSYIGLHRAVALHRDAQAHLTAMKGYNGRIDKLVRSGGADKSEASRAKDLVLAAQNRVSEFKGQVLAAEAQYIEAVGSAPSGDLAQPPQPFNTEADTAIEEIVGKISSTHPQIRMMKERIASLGYDADAEGKSILPMLNSELSYSKKDQEDLIGGESKDAKALLRLNWNLDTGGAQLARKRRAQLMQDDAYQQLEELRRSVERNLRIALAGLGVAKDQKDIQADRYAQAKRTLSTYKEQFEASQKTVLDLMQAENQAFATEAEKTLAEYRVLEASYGFLASQGRITDAIDVLMVVEDVRFGDLASVTQTPEIVESEMKTAKVDFAPLAQEEKIMQEAAEDVQEITPHAGGDVTAEAIKTPVPVADINHSTAVPEIILHPEVQVIEDVSSVSEVPSPISVSEEAVVNMAPQPITDTVQKSVDAKNIEWFRERSLALPEEAMTPNSVNKVQFLGMKKTRSKFN